MTASLKASADGLSASLQVGGVDQLTVGAGIQLSHRNRIINGAFQINQRVVSGTVTLTAGQYGHDRWKAGASGCTYTFATSGGLTTLTISAGSLQQVIEDVNVPFGTNTLCMSWAGTAQGKIAAGSYATSGVTASVTGGSNLTVEFGTGTLTKVQIEVGPSATPFEQRPVTVELALCQRYYEKSYDDGTSPGTATTSGVTRFSYGAASSGVYATAEYKVPKRTYATVNTWDEAGNATRMTHYNAGTLAVTNNLNALASNWAGLRAHGFSASTATAGAAGTYTLHWTASAEL